MSGLFDIPGVTTTQTNQNVDWLRPYWSTWLNNLSNITPSSMPVYGGPQVAPLNQSQNTAIDMSNQLAMNGTPAYNAATSAIQNQAGGTTNPYEGVDPYTQSVINNTNLDMTQAYQRGTAAQTDAAMARQGAYGGSAYNELTGANNKAFAQAVGSTDSGLLNQNYYNNAALWNQDQQRQLQASGLGLASQGTDLQAINNLASMGSMQQGNTQADMGAMQNYFNQSTMAPFVSSQILGSGLSQAGGAPATVTQTQGAGQLSPWALALAGYGIYNYFNPPGNG